VTFLLCAVAWATGPLDLAPLDPQDDASLVPAPPDLPTFTDPDPDLASPYVTNGENAPAGAWPDAASVDFSCTGTLIHPRFVVTADHCTPGNQVVYVGMTSFSQITRGGQPEEGVSRAEVRRVHQLPGREYRDIALLELDQPIRDIPPRLLAADCILEEDLYVGAEVAVVGWGATQWSGGGYTTRLQQGVTRVQTPDCADDQVRTDVGRVVTGCDPRVAPGGEIGAGGNDVDSCFGDSGGPLYLLSPRGEFLIGVTSRSYAGVPAAQPCRYGGIYTRPDAVRDWIERTIGEPLPRPVCTEIPVASAAPLAVRAGNKAKIDLTVADDGADWTVTVVTPPARGEVEIDGQHVTYRAPKDFAGPDPFTLQVVDDGAAAWPDNPPGTALVNVELDVFQGKVPDELKDRVAGCACDGTGRATPWSVAALLALIGLRRRR
jgi:hypothetical protein